MSGKNYEVNRKRGETVKLGDWCVKQKTLDGVVSTVAELRCVKPHGKKYLSIEPSRSWIQVKLGLV